MTSFLFDRGTLNISITSYLLLEAELLEEAVIAGKFDTITYLLQRGGNPEQPSSQIAGTASDAIRLGFVVAKHRKGVVSLAAERAHWSDWRCAGHGGGSETLHILAANGNLDVCKILIQYGADANPEIGTQWKPIHNSAWHGYPEIINFLRSHGADPKAQSMDFYTPLHCAVHDAHAEYVRLIL